MLMSGWKQIIKSKRWLLVVAVLKQFLAKTKPSQIQTNQSGSRKHTKRDACNEIRANSGARVECFVCKDIKCALTMVIGEEVGFVLLVPQKRTLSLTVLIVRE